MRAVFGVVSLLVALAIVGVIVNRQMKALKPDAALSASTGAAVGAAPTVRDSSRQLQDQVRNDVAKALDQSASRNGLAP
jgi:hypothetical protein